MRSAVFIGYVVIYAALNAGGLLLLRSVLESDGGLQREVLADVRLYLGIALYAVGFAMWLATLTRYPLSIVYPIFVGVGYCSVVLAAFVVLHETASVTKVVGISLVGLGLLLVVR